MNFNRGITTVNEITEESQIVINFVQKQLGLRGSDIILFGRSMGSGVAVHLEKIMDEAPAAMVLVSPFTSINDVVKSHTNACISSLLSSNHFNNLDRISKILCPLLIIHGTDDGFIPVTHSRKLY